MYLQNKRLFIIMKIVCSNLQPEFYFMTARWKSCMQYVLDFMRKMLIKILGTFIIVIIFMFWKITMTENYWKVTQQGSLLAASRHRQHFCSLRLKVLTTVGSKRSVSMVYARISIVSLTMLISLLECVFSLRLLFS